MHTIWLVQASTVVTGSYETAGNLNEIYLHSWCTDAKSETLPQNLQIFLGIVLELCFGLTAITRHSQRLRVAVPNDTGLCEIHASVSRTHNRF